VRIFYFGCWSDSGHYLFTPDGNTVRCNWSDFTTPTPWTLRELDAPADKAVLQPAETRAQGVWRLSHRAREGATWTALGCHDYTQDRRPGSVSVFVAEGEHDEQAMREIATRHFPAVWARILGGRP
jgi:hypothetical protein